MIADPASLSISRARSMNGAQWTALLNSLPKSSSFQKNSNKFYLKVSQFWASSILQKKTNRKFNFYCNGVLCIMYYYGQTVFVCLLRELKTPNRRFNIKRPLSTKHFKIGSGFKILTKALLQEMDVPSSVNFFKPDGSRRRTKCFLFFTFMNEEWRFSSLLYKYLCTLQVFLPWLFSVLKSRGNGRVSKWMQWSEFWFVNNKIVMNFPTIYF